MGSTELLVFRGTATQESPGGPLVVCPFVNRPDGETVVMDLAGSHAELAGVALDAASLPVTPDELHEVIAQRCDGDRQLARELVDQLVACRALSKVVPAVERVTVEGDDGTARALRLAVSRATWFASSGAVTIRALGVLGSASWRERLSHERKDDESVFTLSIEGAAAWIGPGLGRVDTPCPACLAARRTAVRPEALTSGVAIAVSPRSLDVICQQTLLRAERWVTGACDDGVLHVSEDVVSVRPLLRQPGCHYCVRSTSVEDAPQRSNRALEVRFRRDWARTDASEPSETQRTAFEDALLGPLDLKTYSSPGLFRGIPVVLGSIRLLQPIGKTFERRELFSVTFGGGMTESRRCLVGFAEGIERYALSIDPPDIRNRRLSELGHEALNPSETVRFAPEQCTGEPGAPARYEDQPLDWSWACEWTTQESRLLVHDVFAYDRDRSASAPRWVDDPFSSGAAAHRSLAHASRRAVLELVERDALMLAWYLQLPLRELDLRSSRNRDIDEVCAYLNDAGIQLRCFDLRVDFDLPSVLLSARATKDLGQWRSGGQILSPSTAPTWEEAVMHALQEILGHYSTFALISPDGDSSMDPATGEVRLWWPNFAAYFNPRQDDPFSFLGTGTLAELPSDQPNTLDESLTTIQAQFRARDLKVFIRYLGSDVVRRSGLVAVRACAPGLVRMTACRSTINFGEPRVEQIRARWRARSGFNPLPHPIS